MKLFLDTAIYEEIEQGVTWGVLDGVTTNATLIAKAGKVLAGEGTRINVTLCFSVNQALLAAAIGAYIVSPFAGRLDDINEDGMRVVADIVAAYRQQEIKTKVLAASIRNPMHVTQAALAGADIATMPFGVLKMLFEHPLTAAGQKKFLEDYRKTQEAKPVRTTAEEAATKR